MYALQSPPVSSKDTEEDDEEDDEADESVATFESVCRMDARSSRVAD